MTTIAPPSPAVALPIRMRLPDGRVSEHELPAGRHRRIHLHLLHAASDGYAEIAAGPRTDGRLRVTTRRDAGHFLPGGAIGDPDWLDRLAGLAGRHADLVEEVFIGPAVRRDRGASKEHVSHTHWLWIDVDGPDRLPAARAFARRKAPQLVIASAGSGGVHCYWRLRDPLPAELIERAHERLIHALGHEWRDGRPVPTVADAACKDRSRVMRLAGTVNGKTGRHARILWADLALAAWPVRELLGDLPDPPTPTRARARVGAPVDHDDPYKRIAPIDYFRALAGITVPAHRLVSCPNPAHDDATPSCHVGLDAGDGWCCFACGASGAIYDLASVLLGGPTGRWLRGDAFRRARDHVARAFT